MQTQQLNGANIEHKNSTERKELQESYLPAQMRYNARQYYFFSAQI